MADLWTRTNHFVDKESGLMHRVEAVSEGYASISVLTALPKRYSMRVEEFDASFVDRFTPVDMGMMPVPAKYRPPRNADRWGAPPPPDLDGTRGETPDGVRIDDVERS